MDQVELGSAVAVLCPSMQPRHGSVLLGWCKPPVVAENMTAGGGAGRGGTPGTP